MLVRRVLPLGLLAFGCTPPPTPVVTHPPGGPQVTAWSESSQVTALLPVAPYALVGTTRGLDRYDLRSGEARPFDATAGLPTANVIALGASLDRKHVWALTADGLVHLDEKGAPQHVAPPAGVEGPFAALAVEPDGGVWVGGADGLFRADPGGKLWAAGFTRPVTALAAGHDGALWIGADATVVLRRPNGQTVELGRAQGMGVARIAALAEWPDGAVVAIGASKDGRARLAFVDPEGAQTFRPSPETPLLGAARRGGELVLLTPKRMYALSLTGDDARLSREGLHLVGLDGAGRSPVDVVPWSAPPPTPTVVAGEGGDVLVGTRALGTARVGGAGTRAAAAWLRRHDLVSGAERLSVACETATRCFVATGAGPLWRLDETGFAPFPPDTAPTTRPASASASDPDASVHTLAVVRTKGGGVIAIERTGDASALRVSRLESGTFRPLPELVVVVAGGAAGVSFARMAPDGKLWLGLTALDAEGDPRPAGMTAIDLDARVLTTPTDLGGAPLIPEGAVDVAFVSPTEMWFATQGGAARVKDGATELFGEPEGLAGEVLRSIAATPTGTVYAASSAGVSVFVDGAWKRPPGLSTPAGALTDAPDGRVWIGTARGLFGFDGTRLTRVDERLGLVDRDVRGLALDHLGRVWALTAEGVSIVDP